MKRIINSTPPEVAKKASEIIHIPADTKFLETVGKMTNRFAGMAGFNESSARKIELAVNELVTNAIIHGYSGDSSGKISLEASIFEEGLMIVMEEKGVRFDPTEVEDPDLKGELLERKEGGLGLFLVKQIMDEIYYESDEEGIKKFTLIKKSIAD